MPIVISPTFFTCAFVFSSPCIPTGKPVVSAEILHVSLNRYDCPNILGKIQVHEIDDVAPLAYELTVSSSDGCALQTCPMLLTPEERTGLNITLRAGVNHTIKLEVYNDCGSDHTTFQIETQGKDSMCCIILCISFSSHKIDIVKQ